MSSIQYISNLELILLHLSNLIIALALPAPRRVYINSFDSLDCHIAHHLDRFLVLSTIQNTK